MRPGRDTEITKEIGFQKCQRHGLKYNIVITSYSDAVDDGTFIRRADRGTDGYCDILKSIVVEYSISAFHF